MKKPSPQKIQFDSLQAFFLAAKHRKFYLAAQEMSIDSSAITRHIQKLEKHLKCQLFDRNGAGRFALTQQGEALAGVVTKVFENVAQIEPTVARVTNLPEGPLKVALHPGITSELISPLLSNFLEKFPKIDLDVIAKDGHVDVNIREADIAIRPWIVDDESDMIQKPLFSYGLKLYASREYISRFGMPVSVEDLRNHRLIGSSSSLGTALLNVNWHLQLGVRKPHKPYATSNSNLVLRSLVRGGIGIGSLSPDLLGPEGKELVCVLPDIEGPRIHIYFMYGQHFHDSKRVDVLYEHLKENMK
jgi:DNA-binding transcriptional LysR family regulator